MDTDSAPEVKESRVARAEREAELSAILARNIARHGAIQANADAYPEPSERARNPMVYDVRALTPDRGHGVISVMPLP